MLGLLNLLEIVIISGHFCHSRHCFCLFQSPQVDSSSSRQAVGSSRDSLNLLTLSQRFKAHAAPGAPSTGVKSSPHCLPQGLLKPMPNGPAASGLSFLLHSRSQEEGDDIEHAECSICCEALKVKPTVQLDCSHVFHKICVQTWLDRNQTCPHCRAHTLMPDEYPTLGASSKHSRRRWSLTACAALWGSFVHHNGHYIMCFASASSFPT